jgi:cytochrome bd ubiquinol oxidase subunit II
MNWSEALPVTLMGLAMLFYVVLDGYDLGVGLLLPRGDDADKDTMIASIGPFCDANETWLVLGVGILLIAFPKAHGLVLTALYLPVALMLIGLILRGVAFDFRVKAQDAHKPLWNFAFFAGSGLAAAAQGWMLGHYITGLKPGLYYDVFAGAIALALPAAYVLLGAIALLPIPLTTVIALIAARALLNSSRVLGALCWTPFVLVVLVFVLGFFGLAYSLYVILIGCAITVPAIVGYTVFSYRIFHGKARALSYA